MKEEAGQQDGFRAIQFHLSVNDNERFIGCPPPPPPPPPAFPPGAPGPHARLTTIVSKLNTQCTVRRSHAARTDTGPGTGNGTALRS